MFWKMITFACDVEMDYRGANVESERPSRDINIVYESYDQESKRGRKERVQTVCRVESVEVDSALNRVMGKENQD